jgi:hypothetical protein
MSKRKAADAAEEKDSGKPTRGMYAARRVKFTRIELDKLARSNHHHQQVYWDTEQKRLSVLVSHGPKHAKRATVTFRAIYYLKSRPGKPQYLTIGHWPDDHFLYPWKDDDGKPITISCSDIDAVRNAAAEIYSRAQRDKDPRRPEASDIFEDVVTEYLESCRSKQRTFKGTEYLFGTFIVPEWRNLRITDIKRSDVTNLLDKIKAGKIKSQNGNGNIGTDIVARAAFSQLRTLFNWYALRSDTFNSPIVKGMTQGIAKAKARERVLSDLEIRTMWPLLDGSIHGAVIKLALLTAQRFGKVREMRRSELKERMLIQSYTGPDGEEIAEQEIDCPVWDPTRDDDPKNKLPSLVPLSKMAQQVIAEVPIINDCDYVFSFDGHKPVGNSFDLYMRQTLDEPLHEAVPDIKPWQLRDLRRTARTMMTREGVSREIAERCLGHTIRGVEGIYNRYDYVREKQDAFNRLANRLERIVNPPTDNVIDAAKRLRRLR